MCIQRDIIIIVYMYKIEIFHDICGFVWLAWKYSLLGKQSSIPMIIWPLSGSQLEKFLQAIAAAGPCLEAIKRAALVSKGSYPIPYTSWLSEFSALPASLFIEGLVKSNPPSHPLAASWHQFAHPDHPMFPYNGTRSIIVARFPFWLCNSFVLC